WPDGSIKWSGFATVLPGGTAGPVTLSTGSSAVSGVLKVTHGDTSLTVDTGALQCSIPLAGANFIDSMTVEGRPVVGPGQLICILQSGPDGDADDVPPREKFVSSVKKVTVEQNGPVRA